MTVTRIMLFWHSWRLAVWSGRLKFSGDMIAFHGGMAAACAAEIQRRVLKPVSIEEADAAIARAKGMR